jgi:uncharacterized membrane protein
VQRWSREPSDIIEPGVEIVDASSPGHRHRTGVAAAFLAMSSVWTLLIVAAPAMASHPHTMTWPIAVVTYAVGARVCHQRPDRSFHLGPTQLPVCARCTGMYLGAPIGAALAMATRRSRRFRPVDTPPGATVLLAMLVALTLLTLAIEAVGVPVAGEVRAVSGLLLSLGASWMVVGSLVREHRTGEVN